MTALERMWTMPEIADALGLARSTVEAYKSRGQMPAPTGRLGRTPYWTAAEIEPWIQGRARRRES